MNPIKNIASWMFWTVYTPLSAEFFVKTVLSNKVNAIKEALSEFGSDLSTLEIGCAEGYITRTLAKKSAIKSGIGCDILPQRLRKGPRRAKQEGVDDIVSFYLSDGRRLPFENNATDVVMLLDILEHIPHKKDVIKCLSEAYRVSSKGLVISIPQTDSKNWLQRNAKYLDLDHVRILMLYDNSWVYNPNLFQEMLKEQGYDFKRLNKSDELYVIKKI